MSIWCSIGYDGPDVMAVEDDGDTAHYTGVGERTIQVGVAVTGQHHLTRLTLCRDPGPGTPGVDVDVLLPPDDLRLLRDRLTDALEQKGPWG